MAHDHTPKLPDIFPQGRIRVDDEQHRYETFEGDAGDVLPKTEYTLNKAPVDSIEEVTGVYNGRTTEFTQGTDYSLQDLVRDQQGTFTFFLDNGPYTLQDSPDTGSTVVVDDSGDTYTEGVDYEIFNPDDIEADTLRFLDGGSKPDDTEEFTVEYTVTFSDSIIKWDDAERTPDAGSIFYVSYKCDSIISRYVEAADEELRTIEDELNAIIEGKFVDSAEGQELDEIGKIFGVLGKRSGRTDTQYRIYLKSVVQSFVSRGTVNGIKLAISAATDVPLEDITIDEDFEDNSYEVIVIPQTPVDGDLLEQVAEIADPSGVEQSLTRFTLEPDEAEVNDTVEIAIADTLAADDMTSSDDTGIFNRANFEDLFVSETIEIDPNKFAASDQMAADDAFAIDPNQTTTSDDATVADAAASTRGSADEDITADEAVAIDPNQTTESDEVGAADATASTRGSADENITADETVQADTNTVSWDDSSWDNFNWATENN